MRARSTPPAPDRLPVSGEKAAASRLDLGGRAPFRRQGDMGERRVRRRPMPVLLLRRDVHDVARGDDLLLRLRRDDALARGHEQYLIAAVGVHLVPGARTEVDDAEVEILAGLRRQERLPGHRATGEQGRVDGFGGNLRGLVDLHGYPPFEGWAPSGHIP